MFYYQITAYVIYEYMRNILQRISSMLLTYWISSEIIVFKRYSLSKTKLFNTSITYNT